MPATLQAQTIDVREIAPRDRHRLIFEQLAALAVGESLQLVNDHEPRPLRYQLEDRWPDQFEWSTVESGPALWRVQIARVGSGPNPAVNESCCSGGACCG